MHYSYEISGSGADGQTWLTTGVVGGFKPGEFNRALAETMRDGFLALTHGRAIYGNPGLGCNGPYRVTRLLVEEIDARGA